MFEISDLIKELKLKYPSLKEDVIEELARIQFKWLLEQIQSAKFKPIKLLYIGKFYPRERSKLYWEKRINEGTIDSSKRYKRKTEEWKDQDKTAFNKQSI